MAGNLSRAKSAVSALNARIWKMIHTIADTTCHLETRLLQLLWLSQQSIVFIEIAIIDVSEFHDLKKSYKLYMSFCADST